ncbi:terminase gpA endonuclease subunit [Acuticoccus mangrovi]|uniref:terminase gpA endonuclease subunit n=1 Tax=Acuticoccus mangrovi TaxID=2796142 RepID=UPI001B3BF5EE
MAASRASISPHATFLHPAGLDLPVPAAAIDTGGHHTKHPRLAAPPDSHEQGQDPALHHRRGRGEGRGLRPPAPHRTRPGAIHFPRRPDADYFRQLTAERVVTRFERGRPIRSCNPCATENAMRRWTPSSTPTATCTG